MPTPLTVHTYARCSTCQKATAWLKAHGIAFVEKPIYTEPPSPADLRRMLGLQNGEVRKLFNTSGLEYRARGLKDTLADMPLDQALALLASEGRLVKRPFLLSEKTGLLGFREEQWAQALLDK